MDFKEKVLTIFTLRIRKRLNLFETKFGTNLNNTSTNMSNIQLPSKPPIQVYDEQSNVQRKWLVKNDLDQDFENTTLLLEIIKIEINQLMQRKTNKS